MRRTTALVPVSGGGAPLARRAAAPPTFEDVLVAFLANRAKTPDTLRAYRREVERWLRFCADHDADPTAPPPALPAAYRQAISRKADGSAAAPATIDQRLAVLSSAYSYARYCGVLEINPFARRTLPRDAPDARTPTPAVTPETVDAMVKACRADRNRERGLRDEALLKLAYATGLRREALAIAARDGLREEDGAPVLRVRVKGGKLRDFDIPPPALAAIKAYLKHLSRQWGRGDATGPIFRAVGATRGLRVDEVWSIIRGRGAEVGAHVAPHQFRAAYMTRGYDAVATGKIAEVSLSKSAGHARLETSQRYDRHRRGRGVAALLYDLKE